MNVKSGAAPRESRDTAIPAASPEAVPGGSSRPAQPALEPGRFAERWTGLFRHGPYLFLGAGALLSAGVARSLMSPGQIHAAGLLVLCAVGLQLWWDRRGYAREQAACFLSTRTGGPGPPAERPPSAPASSPVPAARRPSAGETYYGLRLVLAFALSVLNPFFALYALWGYFEAVTLLRQRWVPAGLTATAVVMAGSQAGGLPPRDAAGWAVFGGLFVVNAVMALLFARMDEQRAENARAKVATIAELERTNSRLEQALEENAGLHAQLLVQAREAGVSDERSRLAAEIHDTLAQGLTGIVTQLQAATDSLDHAAARAHVEQAAALARQSLGEARRSVQDLAPGELELDALPGALQRAADDWSAATGVRAEFTVTGTAEPLHAEIEATMLRIAQEAMANARRHAGASRLGVTLSFMDEEVSLDVRDDGRGFDPAAEPAGEGGFGLRGMRARAERLAGRVDVESEPGYGTAVSARVPLVRHG